MVEVMAGAVAKMTPIQTALFSRNPYTETNSAAATDNRKIINIRVTEKEKQTLDSLAAKCGLSLSEYLRKRGLGYEPGPLLDDRFYAVYSKLCDISNLPLQPDTEAVLITILNDLQQNLFLPRKQAQKEIVEEVRLSLQQDSGP
jgi:hypothetical protein